jgi:PIN domain nuclease of toxin-antitoxin system
MIVLDTHVWIWWVHGAGQITAPQLQAIQANEPDTIGISAISVWEVAKLVERGRLELPCSLAEWFEGALTYPGIAILGLTPEIAIESVQLPGSFHRDPADQLIVATARVYDCSLLTSDARILNYPYVQTIG